MGKKIDIIENLEGGTIYDIKLDFFLHRITFCIRLPFTYNVEYYELILEKVFDFSFFNKYHPVPWAHIELSEIGVDEENNEYIFSMDLWELEIKIKCLNYKVSMVNSIKVDLSNIEYERKI